MRRLEKASKYKKSIHRKLCVVLIALAAISCDLSLSQVTLQNNLSTQKIVFDSRQGGDYEIIVMNIDGSEMLQLTDNEANDFFPVWSPDGKLVLFESNRDGNFELYIMNADGTDQRNLTNHVSEDRAPSWSPDGQWIVFTSDRDGDFELYLTSMNGDQIVQVTQNTFWDYSPNWSADGSRIVFVSDRDDDVLGIFVADLEERTVHKILEDFEGRAIVPVWSPSGEEISFASDRDGNFDIFVMDVETKMLRKITDDSVNLWDDAPNWSPDGTELIFASNREGSYEIYIINADGSNLRRITYNEYIDSAPSWRP